MSLNKFMGIGYLGADSELRHTQSGEPVLNFRVGITEKWKGRDGQNQERTEWVSCVLWGSRGEALAPYLTTGTRVYIEGNMRSSKYQDREGIERYKTEINIRELELLGGGRDDGQRQQRGGYGGGQQRGGQQQGQRDGYGGGQQRGGYGGGGQRRGGGQQQGQRGNHGGRQQGQRGRQQGGQQQGGQHWEDPQWDDPLREQYDDNQHPLGDDQIPF